MTTTTRQTTEYNTHVLPTFISVFNQLSDLVVRLKIVKTTRITTINPSESLTVKVSLLMVHNHHKAGPRLGVDWSQAGCGGQAGCEASLGLEPEPQHGTVGEEVSRSSSP